MARIRTVKPEYPKHKKVRRVSRDARLLNIHLWNLADDEGRLQELPRWIIGEVFPADEDVTPEVLRRWLAELERVGLIVRYMVDGEALIQCHDFTSHQRINRPSESLLPAPDAGLADSVNDQGAIREASPPEQGTGNREQGTPKPPEGGDVEAEVFAYWQQRLDKPDHKLTRERRRKIRARLNEGYELDDLKLAIDGIAASPFHRGHNDNGREHIDLTLICRNGSKLEEYREMGRKARPAQRPVEQLGQRARDRLEAAA